MSVNDDGPLVLAAFMAAISIAPSSAAFARPSVGHNRGDTFLLEVRNGELAHVRHHVQGLVSGGCFGEFDTPDDRPQPWHGFSANRKATNGQQVKLGG